MSKYLDTLASSQFTILLLVYIGIDVKVYRKQIKNQLQLITSVYKRKQMFNIHLEYFNPNKFVLSKQWISIVLTV